MDGLDSDKGMSYDLRQYRAKVIGERLINLDLAKDSKEFPQIHEQLLNLYDKIHHLAKDKAGLEQQFLVYKDKITLLSNNFRGTWFGQNNDSKAHAQIEDALREFDRYLMVVMEDAKIFGSKEYDEDDE